MILILLMLASSPIIETLEAPLAKTAHGVSKMHATCTSIASNADQLRCVISIAYVEGDGSGECYLNIDEPFERVFSKDGPERWRSTTTVGKYAETIVLNTKSGMLRSSTLRLIDMDEGKAFKSADYSTRRFPIRCTSIAGYLP